MEQRGGAVVNDACKAAMEVLRVNNRGPFGGLPRAAGWGYPEPYTRDLLISALGILVSGDKELIASVRAVLEALAKNQSRLGQIPSLAHEPENRGASDTTPLFLLIAGIYRQFANEPEFCRRATEKALVWMEYQSDEDRVIVSQLPTSDWRDEQWVLGYGLYVNTIVLSYLSFHDRFDRLQTLKHHMCHLLIGAKTEGFSLPEQPYYAMWFYKVYQSERFDLLGNSLAILSGLASQVRAQRIIRWVEVQCELMRQQRLLALELPPNFFPYIERGDSDWLDRYEKFNKPGDYHNGGIWPFVCGFYIAAVVAAGLYELAEQKLEQLALLVGISRTPGLDFGFNEWFKAQTGEAKGQDWQTWSAAMFLYAAWCVEHRTTPFFDQVRTKTWSG